jgi:hypothetical protein
VLQIGLASIQTALSDALGYFNNARMEWRMNWHGNSLERNLELDPCLLNVRAEPCVLISSVDIELQGRRRDHQVAIVDSLSGLAYRKSQTKGKDE